MSPPTESDGFLGTKVETRSATGCCHSKHTKNCCIATGVFGIVFLLLGIVVILLGEGMLSKKIMASMALTEGSSRTESWLRPPVQPHLTGYAFHVTNPQAVLAGRKPILEEKGPYVYKAVTVKDSDDNMVWEDDGSQLTYRPRKIYTFEPSLSGPGLDPYKDIITVPNIPLWTGLHGLGPDGVQRGRSFVVDNGLGTPFIEVTFDGLLWGYEDELPCLRMDLPKECHQEGDSPFGADDWEEGDGGDDWDFKRRRKREAPEFIEPEDSIYAGLSKPKAEFVDCKCNWGLFRDRNITLRKPVKFMTGLSDLSLKGVVTEFDGKKELGWWKPGSECDRVKGQDSSTLPPGLTKDSKLDVFISLMCRGLPMEFEKETEHADIKTLRFIPTPNAMSAHDDPDPTKANPDNECYCLKNENPSFKCYKSGVLNMTPCKRDTKAPLALSMPHFYGADSSYVNAVGGLSPEKEKHEFYMDVVPEFGFPLAIRPRFQLNLVIGRYIDPSWDVINQMQEELILPFLWAQDGFSEPSEAMAEQIAFGLRAPKMLSMLGAVVFFVIGAILLLVCLGYFVWARKANGQANLKTPQEMATF